MKKLTLSMKDDVIKRAKWLAKQRGTSVSAMVSEYVVGATQARRKPFKVGPITRKATGLVRLPSDKSDRDLITEALMEKYGLL
ncbi:MAG: DUF6364 family protein [Planctomycetota bacterium]|nr:DUF6364 family protein [Planctomycetota bacterium]